jgi:glycosidase
VIFDIVLNHAGRVFDYVLGGRTVDRFQDPNLVNGITGGEPPIQWMNGLGFPRADWQDTLPGGAAGLSPDDAVWPVDLQRNVFFRRRGSKVSDKPVPPRGFAPGDFDVLRQLCVEYDAQAAGQGDLVKQYGRFPVLTILIRAYQYLIAKYDVDGFRIDTVKYVEPDMVETFCNAVREFAFSVGKANFFTFGEVYDDESTIDQFIGRNGGDVDGFGMDAALDFPLFYKLPRVAKAMAGVESIRQVFADRKAAERGLISSHGEAGQFFVSFLDNHDQHERINAPGTPPEQVSLGLAVLFCLQGIPCVYYGTEQGLQGTTDGLDSNESTREAMWGKQPTAFDTAHPIFQQLQKIAQLRLTQPALRYGRIYFREVSGNGQDFGHSTGSGGVLAFSRVLAGQEVVVVANTNYSQPFPNGAVLVDLDLNRNGRQMRMAYSNCGTALAAAVAVSIGPGRVYQDDGTVKSAAELASLPVSLDAMEVQIFVPA